MMTVSAIVRRDTPPKKAAAPMSANAPGSTYVKKHCSGCSSNGSGGWRRPESVQLKRGLGMAPPLGTTARAAMPKMRPTHAPMSSIGTTRPDEIAEPADHAASGK